MQTDKLKELIELFEKAPDDKKPQIFSQISPIFLSSLKTISEFMGMIDHYQENISPHIQSQIKSIDKRTEEAANNIIDANSYLSKTANALPDKVKDPLQKQINQIFEFSNFQDLVSQHANEIFLKIQELDEDIAYFKTALSGKETQGFETYKKSKLKRSDAHLLNGPATVDHGQSEN